MKADPAAKPMFVVRGGEQCFAPPTMQEQCDFYAFVFDADRKALQALLDRQLNQPSGGAVHYVPLVAKIIAGFADIHKGYSLTPPDSQLGWMPEIDVALWIPVARIKMLGPIPIIERVGFYMPYVFVDSPIAVAIGRETWGFHKSLGKAQMPNSPSDKPFFSVDAYAVTQPDPAVQVVPRRIFTLERTDSGSASSRATWTESGSALHEIMAELAGPDGVLIPGFNEAMSVLKLLGFGDMVLVFLKQFRDIADGSRACYQAVSEAVASITRFGGGGKLDGNYQLTIEPLVTHPIVQDLGLAGGQLQSSFAFYANFDFIMNEGKEIWRA